MLRKMYLKGKVGILTVEEYKNLRDEASRKRKLLLDLMLYSGMRYVEVQRFHRKQNWYNKKSKTIKLPEAADRKKKRTSPGRYVHLSNYGAFIVERYIETDQPPPPSPQGMWSNLRRWAKKIGLKKISLKTTRKTWESWLVVSFKELIPLICMSQGHTELISMKHYLNIPFSSEEIKQIKERTSGIFNQEV